MRARKTNKKLGKRPFFVLGKQKELCHVVLEHGSISRQHAAIVHGQVVVAAAAHARRSWSLLLAAAARASFSVARSLCCFVGDRGGPTSSSSCGEHGGATRFAPRRVSAATARAPRRDARAL
jgi:hypothetical protein